MSKSKQKTSGNTASKTKNSGDEVQQKIKNQLIVVVHGVNGGESGECSELLTTAIDDHDYALENEQRFLSLEAVHSDDHRKLQSADTKSKAAKIGVSLKEGDTAAKGNSSEKQKTEGEEPSSLSETFPTTIRRYKKSATANKALPDNRTFADFYWSDISSVGKGPLSLFLATIGMFLSFCHPLRHNAAYVFKNHPFMKWLVDVFIKTIHGPIAAMNVVVFGGLVTAWLLKKSILQDANHFNDWAGFIIGALAICGGIVLYIKQKAYLGKLLAVWIGSTGCIFLYLKLLQNYPDLLPQKIHGFAAGFALTAGLAVYLLYRSLSKTQLCWEKKIALLTIMFVGLHFAWASYSNATDLQPQMEKLFCHTAPDKPAPVTSTSGTSVGDTKTMNQTCKDAFTKPYIVGGQLMLMLQGLWIFAIFVLSLIILGGLFLKKEGVERARNFVGASATVMVFLWLLLTGMILGGVAYTGLPILPDPHWAQASFVIFPVVIFLLVMLVIAALWSQFGMKGVWCRELISMSNNEEPKWTKKKIAEFWQ